MELPNLGKHCAEPSCRRLDFLPVNCDSCKETFCSEHYTYQKHSCKVLQRKDVQIPICPLCGQKVPTSPETSPDITVGHHIDQNCPSTKQKIFTNRCHYGDCKKKELIPFKCSVCKKNFCISHRHTADHKCEALELQKQHQQRKSEVFTNVPAKHQNSIRNFFQSTTASLTSSNAGSTSRQAAALPSRQLVQQVQGNMTEDEALAHALALSLQQEEEEESRQQANRNRSPQTTQVPVGGTTSKDKCSLS